MMDDSPSDSAARAATKPEHIRDAAMRCFAERGIAATSLRSIAAAADVSLGLIQHYFVTKQQLIDCINQHVLHVVHQALGTSPNATAAASADEAGARFAKLLLEYPHGMDYIARALSEADEVGTVLFDGLYAVSQQQRVDFTAQGLAADGLDPVWAAMLPLILRMGTIMLRPHLERHLPGPLYDPVQIVRWETAVTRMIGEGQIRRP